MSSDDLAGLAEVRRHVGVDVAAGEYGYDLAYFERMCAAEAVDVLQVDVSRCAGITEWLRAAAVAAVPNLRHVEYFADHARVDRLLFDGVAEPTGGVLHPDDTRVGCGLELKRADAHTYRTR